MFYRGQNNDRVLKKINDNEKIILDRLKKFPNEKLFHKKVVNQKDIWFFNVSTEEKNQSFLEKHKAIESECKKDYFVKHSNNKKIKSLQRQKKEKETTPNNLTIAQQDRIIRYENIIALEGTDSEFMKREGNLQKYGILYYQDPEDSNIVVQESIQKKPKRLKVVTQEKKLKQIDEKKEIVTKAAVGQIRAIKLFPKTSENNFKEFYEGFRAKYPVGSAIIKIDRKKEEAIDIATEEGIIELEEATKLEHLIAYRGKKEDNMFNIKESGRLYYLKDLNFPEKMVAQRPTPAFRDRRWYRPSAEEINAVMTSLKKKNGYIKFDTESKIYPITTDKKEKKEFKTKFKDFDDKYGINGESTVKNRDKIGKKIKPENNELNLTASEIEKYITPKNLKAWTSTSRENKSPFEHNQQSYLRIVMYYLDKENKRLIRHTPGGSLGQNNFKIVKKESSEYKKAENFILSEENLRLKEKGKNTARFWHRRTKEIRKEPGFTEKFEAYRAKYCLPNLVVPLVPSGKTDLAPTKRPPKRNNEDVDGKPKAKKRKTGRLGI